jgi:subtilase family serine protease
LSGYHTESAAEMVVPPSRSPLDIVVVVVVLIVVVVTVVVVVVERRRGRGDGMCWCSTGLAFGSR